ncbi:MAG: disulfide bond formation protein DsbA [Actinomycetales bacterium]
MKEPNNTPTPDVTLFVDPSCPFAWITSRWLLEVMAKGAATVRMELVSLSVINEGRELDDWYREFNDQAWGPARVAAALQSRTGSFDSFYDAYGRMRHVEGRRDTRAMVTDALRVAGLDAGLDAAADDPSWDAVLRARTRLALEPVGEDVGTPIIHVEGEAFFGPVLTGIPRGQDAVDIFDAVVRLSRHRQFVEYKRGRGDLETS